MALLRHDGVISLAVWRVSAACVRVAIWLHWLRTDHTSALLQQADTGKIRQLGCRIAGATSRGPGTSAPAATPSTARSTATSATRSAAQRASTGAWNGRGGQRHIAHWVEIGALPQHHTAPANPKPRAPPCRDSATQELRSISATDVEKRRMLEILQRLHDQELGDEGGSEDGGSSEEEEEEGGRAALSRETARLLLRKVRVARGDSWPACQGQRCASRWSCVVDPGIESAFLLAGSLQLEAGADITAADLTPQELQEFHRWGMVHVV